jgi:hypothetical protein
MKQLKAVEDFDEHWCQRERNHIVVLQGYPSPKWLSHLGSKLHVDYEFLYQHFANPSHVHVGENFCLPAVSLMATDTIQMTFTSIGSWDTYQSGTDLLTARTTLDQSMDAYIEDLNRGRGIQTGDSLVRTFFVHDIKHFSITQQVTIKLINREGYWTSEYTIAHHFS